MKTTRRILCAVLATALVACVMLSGCSAPKLHIGGTPAVAGTVEGKDMPTGEYLTYLYSTYYDMYMNQGLYQYAMYGYDVWSQEYTYGEGEDALKVNLEEYMKLATRDLIARQLVLRDMLASNNLKWIPEEVEAVEKNLKELGKDAYLPMGMSDEHFIPAYKEITLNESAVFYGLYGEGGPRAVSEAERREYFDTNYLSYKMISIPLTDDKGSELSKDDQAKVTAQLEGYLATYNKDKNFEAIVDEYAKSQAAEGTTVEPSKDEDNRVNADATQLGDEELVKAIRGVEVGKAKVVTYKEGGSVNTAALILRLDINEPATLFTDSTKQILLGMKWDAFDDEVVKAMGKKTVDLKKSVVKKCSPINFAMGG